MKMRLLFACAALLLASAGQAVLPPTPVTPAPTSPVKPPPHYVDRNLDDPTAINVVARRRPHRVMRFFFGRHRRPGGFFKNLLHPLHWHETFGKRKHCRSARRVRRIRHGRVLRRCVL